MISLFLPPIIQYDIKAAGHGHYQLTQFLMRVPSAFTAARHVIQIIDTAYFKRHVPAPFNEGEIAAGVRDSGQVNDSTRRQAARLRLDARAAHLSGRRKWRSHYRCGWDLRSIQDRESSNAGDRKWSPSQKLRPLYWRHFAHVTGA